MNSAVKIDERENEVGDRPRGDDRGAVAQRLAGEGRARSCGGIAPTPARSGALAALASPWNLT